MGDRESWTEDGARSEHSPRRHGFPSHTGSCLGRVWATLEAAEVGGSGSGSPPSLRRELASPSIEPSGAGQG